MNEFHEDAVDDVDEWTFEWQMVAIGTIAWVVISLVWLL